MPIANTNRYECQPDGTTRIVTQKGDVYIIDTSDVEITKRHCWSKHTNGYARAVMRIGAKMKTVYLHRLICPTTNEQPHVDHINRDISDCCRANLRKCSHSQNLQNQKRRADNSTGYKGVGLHRPSGCFRARVTICGTKADLGLFETAEQASIAATRMREALHKEFARHA